MKLPLALVQGLDAEQLKDLEQRLRVAAPILQFLLQDLTKELDRAIIRDESGENWNSPNPLAVLADNAGYRRATRQLIEKISALTQ